MLRLKAVAHMFMSSESFESEDNDDTYFKKTSH